MNPTDQAEYEKLSTPAERAQWLIRAAHNRENGITVNHDIVQDSLSLCWRVSIVGVMLPQKFESETPEQAIEKSLAWLGEMAAA